ncbi:MAG: branched-chain amino acid ABC transporter permease [Bacilli bacterium]
MKNKIKKTQAPKKHVSKKTQLISTIVAIVLFAVVSVLIDGSSSLMLPKVFNKICIFSIAALSLNLVCGNLGELVLGHGGFVLIGYVVSYLLTNYVIFPALQDSMAMSEIYNVIYNVHGSELHAAGYAIIIGNAIIAALITAVFGYIVGVIVLGRLKGDYLAIVTLGFGLVFVCLVQNLIPNGFTSLNSSSKLTGTPMLFAGFLVLTVFLLTMFIKSRFGRGIIAIREDAIAAESSGIPVNKYKILAFTVSAFFAGLAGGLYCHFGPQTAVQFNQDLSILLLLYIVLGGLGSFTGTLIATPLLEILNSYVLVVLPASFSNNPKIIYGILLICIMLFKNKGIMGTNEFGWDWFYTLLDKIKLFFKRVFKKRKSEVAS